MESLSADLLNAHGLCIVPQEETVDILSNAFKDDAFHRYVLHTWNGSDTRRPFDVALNKTYFTELMHELSEEGAVCVSLPGAPFVIVCSLLKVGKASNSDAGSGDAPEAVREMDAKSEVVLNKNFEAGSTFLHLFFAAKKSTPDTQNTKPNISVRAIIAAIMRMAASQGWPLHLEATSSHSCGVFTSMGFRVAEEVKVGVGRVDENGFTAKGGNGVSLWMTVFDREVRKGPSRLSRL